MDSGDDIPPELPPGDHPAWRVVDETIVLIGLLLAKELLYRSGYPPDVMLAIDDRLKLLIKNHGGSGIY